LDGFVAGIRTEFARWALTKAGKRIDAELLFHAEYGVEIQFLHEAVMPITCSGRSRRCEIFANMSQAQSERGFMRTPRDR
jgi:hypothetical protein